MLFDLLELWRQDALSFETFDAPRVVLSSYIRAKMRMSRDNPNAKAAWSGARLQLTSTR